MSVSVEELKALRDLLRSVEAAKEPDRELDALLWLALVPGASRRQWSYVHKASGQTCHVDETRDATHKLITVPDYTRSLDAVASLIEVALPGWHVGIVEKHNSHGRWECYIHNNQPVYRGIAAERNPAQRWVTTHGEHAALALCAALIDALLTVRAMEHLKARAALQSSPDGMGEA